LNNFNIEISSTAEKDLDSLEKKDCERILKKLKKIKKDPIRFIERLAGHTLYKLRCGDYRVIIRIDTSREMLQIVMVDHRKNVYKRLQKAVRD